MAVRGRVRQGDGEIDCRPGVDRERDGLRGRAMAVCVPVRDEARALPRLLDALAALDRRDLAVRACFFLDSCADGSEAMLREAKVGFPLHVVAGPRHPDSNAGRARRGAMALGLAAVGGRGDALLLSTDADSAPRADWLQAAARALAVSDVAAGWLLRIGGTRDAPQGRVERYYDRLHAYRRAIDPVAWDTAGCHCGGGANMAVRAGVYAALGGFAAVPAGEDARLLDYAARAGFRARREPGMVIETSSRRLGRAPDGLAASLRALDVTGLPRLQHPAAAVWQWERHAVARCLCRAGRSGGARGVRGADRVERRSCAGCRARLPDRRGVRNADRPRRARRRAAGAVPEAERALAELEGAPCRGAA